MKKNVLAVAIIFAITFSGSAMAVHTGWVAPDETANLKNPFISKKGVGAEGKKIYDKNCAKCHGIGGKGDGESAGSLQIELPDFSNKEVAMVETDGEWFWKIKTGQFEMPPFQLVLNDDEVWQVLLHVRTLAK